VKKKDMELKQKKKRAPFIYIMSGH